MPRRVVLVEQGVLQAIWGITLLVLLAAILRLNGGHLIFTLDDPYIHLAMAEGIVDGHYGVNPSEPSAPSSSLLWPILLAPLVALSAGTWAPLLLNWLFGALTAYLLLNRLQTLTPRGVETRAGSLVRLALSVGVLLAANAPGLAFTGMEHSLQLFLAMIVVDGGFRVAAAQPLLRLHWLAIVIGPWVRYENLALTGAACLFLFAVGMRRSAMTAGAICLTGLIAFSGFLMSLGLPWLPTSVIKKSGMVGPDRGPLQSLWDHLEIALSSTRGLALVALVLLLLGLSAAGKSHSRMGKWCLCLAGAGLLHVLFGIYGWYHRYEPYMLGSLSFAAVCAGLQTLQRTGMVVRLSLPITLGLLAIAFPYTRALPTIPLASNNIYEQQFQVHRFLTEHWKAPAGVNDLGWPAFLNDEYILDYGGLSSVAVQRAKRENKDFAWMGTLAEEHSVQLVVIYESWFPARPKSWIKVAEMALSRRRITPSSAKVSFFATNVSAADTLRPQLQTFQATIPDGVRMRVLSSKTPH